MTFGCTYHEYAWTDDPVTTTTNLKEDHVNQIRAAVEEMEDHMKANWPTFSCSDVSWTDPTLSTIINEKTEHIEELRTATDVIYNALQLTSACSCDYHCTCDTECACDYYCDCNVVCACDTECTCDYVCTCYGDYTTCGTN